MDVDVDDPGIYLAWAEAISIAAPYEDLLFNCVVATGLVTVHSDNAVGSAVQDIGSSRAFISITPDAILSHATTDRAPVSDVRVSFVPKENGAEMELIDLRNPEVAPVKCVAGSCRDMLLQLDSTAVFLFSPVSVGE